MTEHRLCGAGIKVLEEAFQGQGIHEQGTKGSPPRPVGGRHSTTGWYIASSARRCKAHPRHTVPLAAMDSCLPRPSTLNLTSLSLSS